MLTVQKSKYTESLIQVRVTFPPCLPVCFQPLITSMPFLLAPL